MAGPIKPSEVESKRQESIPEEVFKAFNELIVENMVGNTAEFRQDTVVARIQDKMNVTSSEIYNKHWLDVEPLYKKVGWAVLYDKPGYNETYPATFSFTKKK